MTTPERLRRRQLIEGTVLIILSLFLVGTSWTDQRDDAAQRECLADTTQDLTEALNARSEVGLRTNDLRDQRIDLVDERMDFLLAILLRSAQNRTPTEEEQQQLREEFIATTQALQQKKTHLKARIEASKKELAAIPIPPYPEGTCN